MRAAAIGETPHKPTSPNTTALRTPTRHRQNSRRKHTLQKQGLLPPLREKVAKPDEGGRNRRDAQYPLG